MHPPDQTNLLPPRRLPNPRPRHPMIHINGLRSINRDSAERALTDRCPSPDTMRAWVRAAPLSAPRGRRTRRQWDELLIRGPDEGSLQPPWLEWHRAAIFRVEEESCQAGDIGQWKEDGTLGSIGHIWQSGRAGNTSPLDASKPLPTAHRPHLPAQKFNLTPALGTPDASLGEPAWTRGARKALHTILRRPLSASQSQTRSSNLIADLCVHPQQPRHPPIAVHLPAQIRPRPPTAQPTSASTPAQTPYSPLPVIDPHKSNVAHALGILDASLVDAHARKAVLGECYGLARKRKNGFGRTEMLGDAVLTAEE
ncbi:hypothetical protein BJ912DRAFT_1088438 [Pholiota molesta]|nr:hypothetical protein BJ912DRAFT_1088438 [Pholiota molesta]